MKKTLTALACSALISFQAMPAHAVTLPHIQISQMGDLDKSCYEISQEVSSMEDLIVKAQEIRSDTKMTNAGVTVAKTVGSYLVGSLAGGIGILAAGYIVNEATDDRAELATEVADKAAQRRSFMAGVYNAKGCVGPLDLSSIEPAAGDSESYGPPAPPPPPRYSYND